MKVVGSAAISAAADFVIPLKGTSTTPDIDGKLPDAIAPVTGSFTGAFFGPQAAEAGGFAEILKANGDVLQDDTRTWSGVPFLLGR